MIEQLLPLPQELVLAEALLVQPREHGMFTTDKHENTLVGIRAARVGGIVLVFKLPVRESVHLGSFQPIELHRWEQVSRIMDGCLGAESTNRRTGGSQRCSPSVGNCHPFPSRKTRRARSRPLSIPSFLQPRPWPKPTWRVFGEELSPSSAQTSGWMWPLHLGYHGNHDAFASG